MTKGIVPVLGEEEIFQSIKSFGYILPQPRAINPSYYKLSDGTILRAHVNINYILPDPKQPDGFSANTENITISYVPRDERRPASFVPYDPAELSNSNNMVDEDVEFEVLSENFSVYDLTNGLILSLKAVIGQVKKTRFYTIHGEPVYLVTINPIIKIKKG